MKKSTEIRNKLTRDLNVDFKNRGAKIEEKGGRSPDRKKSRGGDVFDESLDLNFNGE